MSTSKILKGTTILGIAGILVKLLGAVFRIPPVSYTHLNLVSPVRIGRGAYIAAGSPVTEDVEGDSLSIARARGTEKTGWVSKKGILKKKK